MAPFSKQEMLEEYRVGMQMTASELAPVVGTTAAAALAWITPEELEDIGPGFGSSVGILESGGANLLAAVYDYAFLGLLSRWLDEEMYEGLNAWKNRFEGLQLIVDLEWRGHRAFQKCVHAIEIANLRHMFPHGSLSVSQDAFVRNCIHLREFALLAGVEEKTVRNMASPKHKQHIPTFNIGRRTYVALKDAQPWLEARGFMPTVLTDTQPHRDYVQHPFNSRHDLAHFVKAQRERAGLSVDATASKLPTCSDAAQRIAAIEECRGAIDADFAISLAEVFEIPNAKEFAEAAVEVCATWEPSVLDTRTPSRRRANVGKEVAS